MPFVHKSWRVMRGDVVFVDAVHGGTATDGIDGIQPQSIQVALKAKEVDDCVPIQKVFFKLPPLRA